MGHGENRISPLASLCFHLSGGAAKDRKDFPRADARSARQSRTQSERDCAPFPWFKGASLAVLAMLSQDKTSFVLACAWLRATTFVP